MVRWEAGIQAGAEVLRRQQRPARDIVRFYQQMATLNPNQVGRRPPGASAREAHPQRCSLVRHSWVEPDMQREEILLELAFYQLDTGQLQAAYDTLAAYAALNETERMWAALTRNGPWAASSGVTGLDDQPRASLAVQPEPAVPRLRRPDCVPDVSHRGAAR